MLILVLLTTCANVTAAPSQPGGPATVHLAAFDCSQPSSVHHFSVLGCQANPVSGAMTRVGLVQRNPTHKIKGYKCNVKMTVSRFICGAFSYEKPVMTAGGLDQSYPLSVSECKRLIKDKAFRPRPTVKFAVDIPGKTLVSDVTLGAVSLEGGDESCQGVTTMINGRTVDRVVEVRTYVVELQPETFEATAKVINALMTQETLPCAPADLGCQGPDHTYMWFGSSLTTCPFALLREVEGQLQAGQFYAPDEGLLLKIEANPTPVPTECDGLEIFATQVDGVLLSRSVPHLPAVMGSHVVPLALLESLAAFTVDLAEEMHYQEAQPSGLKLCHLASRAKQHEIFVLGEGTFGRRLGDSWVQYSCPPARVPIREDQHCWDSVPVQHPTLPYVDVETRILKATAAISPCLDSLPMRVKAEEGWVRLTPQVLMEHEPPVLQTPTDAYVHHAARPTGLYTRGELKDWATLHALPDFRHMVLADVAQTGCTQWASCPLPAVPGAQPPSFLQAAEDQLLATITPGWWTQLKEVTYYWSLCSGGLFLPYFLWCCIISFCRTFRRGQEPLHTGNNLNIELSSGRVVPGA